MVVSLKPEGEKESETHVLMQAVYVLAVNAITTQPEKKEEIVELAPGEKPKPKKKRKKKKKKRRKHAPSVTLAVTPAAAEQLAHAEKIGGLNLLLRNDLDFEVEDTIGVTISDIVPAEEDETEQDLEDPGLRTATEVAAARPTVTAPKKPQPTTRVVSFYNGRRGRTHVVKEEPVVEDTPAPSPEIEGGGGQ